jgi:hypothetical protein
MPRNGSASRRQQRRRPAAPVAAPPPALREDVPEELRPLLEVAQQSPDGWGTVAEVLRNQPDLDLEPLLAVLARHCGADCLPLLAGLAMEREERLSLPALNALPALGSRAAGDALARVYAGVEPSSPRGAAAWQGIRALQARGVAVRVRPPEELPSPRELGRAELREVRESIADGVGTRSVFARLQDRYGVWQTVGVVWNERAGVKTGFRAPIGRNEWERIVELNEQEATRLVPVDPDYARWSVERAARLNEATGVPLDSHLEAWHEELGPAPAGYVPPEGLAVLDGIPDEQRIALAARSSELKSLPDFRSWAVEPADVAPFRERLKAAAGAEGEPSARYAEVLAEAAGTVVSGELAELLRERLAETALKLHWLGDEDAARLAAAASWALAQGRHPGEVTLMGALVEQGITLLEDLLADGEDPEEWRYDPMQPMDEAG